MFTVLLELYYCFRGVESRKRFFNIVPQIFMYFVMHMNKFVGIDKDFNKESDRIFVRSFVIISMVSLVLLN